MSAGTITLPPAVALGLEMRRRGMAPPPEIGGLVDEFDSRGLLPRQEGLSPTAVDDDPEPLEQRRATWVRQRLDARLDDLGRLEAQRQAVLALPDDTDSHTLDATLQTVRPTYAQRTALYQSLPEGWIEQEEQRLGQQFDQAGPDQADAEPMPDASQRTPTAPAGQGWLGDFSNAATRSVLADIPAAVQEMFGQPEEAQRTRERGQFLRPTTGGVATTAGSLAGSLGLSALALIDPGLWPVVLAHAGLMGAGGMGQQITAYERETGKEVTPALAAALMTGAGATSVLVEKFQIGALEHVSKAAMARAGQAILAGNFKAAAKFLAASAATAGTTEGLEEVIEGRVQNLLQATYHPDKRSVGAVLEGSIQDFIGGAVGGAVLGGPAVLGATTRARGALASQTQAQERAIRQASAPLEPAATAATAPPAEEAFTPEGKATTAWPAKLDDAQAVGQWYATTFGDSIGSEAIAAMAAGTPGGYELAQVPLDLIDPNSMQEGDLDAEKVAQMARLTPQEMAELPPVIAVAGEGGRLLVADGAHRVSAAQSRPDVQTIQAYVPSSVAVALREGRYAPAGAVGLGPSGVGGPAAAGGGVGAVGGEAGAAPGGAGGGVVVGGQVAGAEAVQGGEAGQPAGAGMGGQVGTGQAGPGGVQPASPGGLGPETLTPPPGRVEEASRAAQAGQHQPDRVGQHPQAQAGGLPGAAGGGDRPAQGREVPPEVAPEASAAQEVSPPTPQEYVTQARAQRAEGGGFDVTFRGRTVSVPTARSASVALAAAGEELAGQAMRPADAQRLLKAKGARAAYAREYTLRRTDALTGVYNRLGGDEQTAKMLAAADEQGKPVGVLGIDLGFFKQVNDTVGHDAGDKLLAAAADAMEQTVRSGTDGRQADQPSIVARRGGDEFEVVLWDVTPEQAQVVGRRLESAYLDQVQAQGVELPEGLRTFLGFGVAIRQPGGDIAQARQEADADLYRRKAQTKADLGLAGVTREQGSAGLPEATAQPQEVTRAPAEPAKIARPRKVKIARDRASFLRVLARLGQTVSISEDRQTLTLNTPQGVLRVEDVVPWSGGGGVLSLSREGRLVESQGEEPSATRGAVAGMPRHPRVVADSVALTGLADSLRKVAQEAPSGTRVALAINRDGSVGVMTEDGEISAGMREVNQVLGTLEPAPLLRHIDVLLSSGAQEAALSVGESEGDGVGVMVLEATGGGRKITSVTTISMPGEETAKILARPADGGGGMTLEQARDARRRLTEAGWKGDIRIDRPGGDYAPDDAPWHVELWSVSASAGTMTLYKVESRDQVATPQAARRTVRDAVKQAKAEVSSARRRMAAMDEVDAEDGGAMGMPRPRRGTPQGPPPPPPAGSKPLGNTGGYTRDWRPLSQRGGDFKRTSLDRIKAVRQQTAEARARRDGKSAADASDNIYRIVEDLARRFNLGPPGIRRAKLLRGWALGFWMPTSEQIRLANASGASTFFHEVGHHLHKVLFPRTKGRAPYQLNRMDFPKAWRPELLKLGKDLYGTRKPTGGYTAEGWAEIVRYLIVNPAHVRQVAPTVYRQAVGALVTHHPEVWAVLQNSRARLLNAVAAMEDNPVHQYIDYGRDRSRGWNARSLWDRFRARWVDRMQRLSTFKRDLGAMDMPEDEDPQILAWRANGHISGDVKLMTSFGRFDPSDPTRRKTGKSLEEIFQPVQDDLELWQDYMVARRIVEKRGQGLKVFEQDPRLPEHMTTGKLQAFIARVEQQRPAFKQASADFQEFNQWLVKDYAVHYGLLTEEAADLIVQKNLEYITFRHKMTEDALAKSYGAASSRGGFAGRGSGIRRFRPGFGEQLFPPLESFFASLQGIVSNARLNEVARAIVTTGAGQGAGTPRWFSKIETPVQAQKIGPAQLSQEVQKQLGIRINPDGSVVLPPALRDLTDEQFEAVVGAIANMEGATFWQRGRRPDSRNMEFTVLRAGKPVYYEAKDRALYELISGLGNPYTSHLVLRLASIPARTLRAGATQLNPSFFVPNFLRDSMQAVIMTEAEWNDLPAQTRTRLGAMKQAFLGGDLERLFLASGADMSGLFGEYYDPRTQRLDFRKMFGKPKFLGLIKGRGAKEIALDLATLGPIDRLNRSFEMTNRLAEFAEVYRRRLGAGQSESQALAAAGQAAADVTLDFQRGGTWAKDVNQLVPFFNAAILGTDKLGRMIARNPARALGRILTAMLLPSLLQLLLNLRNDDYWAQPIGVRDRHWFCPTGLNDAGQQTYLKIPKPYGLGVFSIAFERSFAALFGINPETGEPGGDPGAFREIGAGLIDELRPTMNLAGIQPLLEVMAGEQGWSFYRNHTIVPASDKNLEKGEQGGDRSSDLARVLGRWLDFPPAKIDYLIQGYLGGLGKDAVQLLADPVVAAVDPQAKEGEPLAFSDWLVVRRFLARQTRQGHEAITRFFDLHDELKRVHGSYRRRAEDPEAADRYAQRHAAELDLWPSFSGAQQDMAKDFSSLRALYRRRSSMDPLDFEKEVDGLYDNIITTARQALIVRREAQNAPKNVR
ncbi:MAG: diguanylate cyclase [Phycisphaeraceae bacterium]|nr:diguanylate cyclase [Phycisphaeraceae bacterium]